ncbi:MAG: BBE domain-containing protein [Actinomycetota bacterium]|nr:BBE domain-containing protein [Actinomycetota bacterium]
MAEDATAIGSRAAPFLIGVEANWESPAADEANIAWTRPCISDLQPFSTGGQYLNFPGFLEGGQETLRVTFGPSYEHLVELKQRYDPTNLFRLNRNVDLAG